METKYCHRERNQRILRVMRQAPRLLVRKYNWRMKPFFHSRNTCSCARASQRLETKCFVTHWKGERSWFPRAPKNVNSSFPLFHWEKPIKWCYGCRLHVSSSKPHPASTHTIHTSVPPTHSPLPPSCSLSLHSRVCHRGKGCQGKIGTKPTVWRQEKQEVRARLGRTSH